MHPLRDRVPRGGTKIKARATGEAVATNEMSRAIRETEKHERTIIRHRPPTCLSSNFVISPLKILLKFLYSFPALGGDDRDAGKRRCLSFEESAEV